MSVVTLRETGNEHASVDSLHQGYRPVIIPVTPLFKECVCVCVCVCVWCVYVCAFSVCAFSDVLVGSCATHAQAFVSHCPPPLTRKVQMAVVQALHEHPDSI